LSLCIDKNARHTNYNNGEDEAEAEAQVATVIAATTTILTKLTKS